MAINNNLYGIYSAMSRIKGGMLNNNEDTQMQSDIEQPPPYSSRTTPENNVLKIEDMLKRRQPLDNYLRAGAPGGKTSTPAATPSAPTPLYDINDYPPIYQAAIKKGYELAKITDPKDQVVPPPGWAISDALKKMDINGNSIYDNNGNKIAEPVVDEQGRFNNYGVAQVHSNAQTVWSREEAINKATAAKPGVWFELQTISKRTKTDKSAERAQIEEYNKQGNKAYEDAIKSFGKPEGGVSLDTQMQIDELKQMKMDGLLKPGSVIAPGKTVYSADGTEQYTVPNASATGIPTIVNNFKPKEVPQDEIDYEKVDPNTGVAKAPPPYNPGGGAKKLKTGVYDFDGYSVPEDKSKPWDKLGVGDVFKHFFTKGSNSITTAITNGGGALVSLGIAGQPIDMNTPNPNEAITAVGLLYKNKTFKDMLIGSDGLLSKLGFTDRGTKWKGNQAISVAKEIYNNNKTEVAKLGLGMGISEDLLAQGVDQSNKGIGYNRPVYETLNKGGLVATFTIMDATGTKTANLQMPVTDFQDINAIQSKLRTALGGGWSVQPLVDYNNMTKMSDKATTGIDDMEKAGLITFVRKDPGGFTQEAKDVIKAGNAGIWDIITSSATAGDSENYTTGRAYKLYKKRYNIP